MKRIPFYLILVGLFTLLVYFPFSTLGAMHSSKALRMVKVHPPLHYSVPIVSKAKTAAVQKSSEASDTLTGTYKPFTLYPELWTSWSIGALVRALATDPTYVWIGTTEGIIQYHRQGEDQQIYTTRDGLMSNIILTIQPQIKSRTPHSGSAPGESKEKSGGLDRSVKRVWFGTYGGGLSYFDGVSWKTYTPYGAGTSTTYGSDWQSYRPGEGLGDLWVYDVAFDADDTMWVATWKGVSKFNGAHFKTYGKEDGLIDAWVYTLSQDPQGSFWFGTEGGVTFYDGKQWKSWTHQQGLGEIPPKEEDAMETYPLAIPHHQQESKQVQTYNPNYVICSVVDRQGSVWFGTWGTGLARFDGEAWKNFTTEDGLSGNVINSLAIDRDGILWIGTNGGVTRYDQNVFITYNKDTGLFSNPVYSIAIDEENHKWFGTLGGLTRFIGP
jgi:ligand-binding sensor domain-containing protein